MQRSLDNLGDFFQNLLQAIKQDPNITELDQYRKVFRKHVPFWMRSYVAAYLIRNLNRDGRLDDVLRQTGASGAGNRTAQRPLTDPVSIFFGAGRSRRTNPREIVKILLEHTGIDRSAIGEIKILENYSFIDVEKEAAPTVIQKLENFTLRGRPVKVNFAKKKEEGGPA